MPADTDDHSWQCLLNPINEQLGDRCDKELGVAAQLCDDNQPVAQHNPPIYLWTATIYIKCRRLDDAMRQLELAFEHGYDDLEHIKGDKDFAPLRKHPRFRALKP